MLAAARPNRTQTSFNAKLRLGIVQWKKGQTNVVQVKIIFK